MNRVILIGRLTANPELKFIPGSGNAVATLTLAVDKRFASKDGQREADFIPVVVWGKQAESTATYMTKGKLMGVSGRIQTRSYEAKDGTRRYVTEVVADEVQFLEWGNKSRSDVQGQGDNSFEPSNNDSLSFGDEMTLVDDGDMPF